MHAPSASFRRPGLYLIVILLLAGASLIGLRPALANNTPQALPYSQNWADIGLITTNDDWTNVPGVIGFRGDGLTAANDVDPQTVLADETTVDVNANQTNPNTFATGGVSEFEIADPVVGLQGSGTADAPFIVLHLNTTGQTNITVAYNLRDIDGSADNSAQQVALQYRVGSTGDFTNLPAGYVADATSGPSLATLVTPVNVVLPAEAENQALVQVRIITTNATGNDEWVGIDDISVTGSDAPTPTPTPSPTPGAAAALVINEVDYDQPSTDTAEFVEIRNNDSVSVDLSSYSLEMVNGSGGGAAQYRLFALPAVSLAPGDYFVVCGNAANVANCDMDVTPDTDLIQNGAPDAVALLFGATIVDTVSYEGDTGAPYTEGTGAGLTDDPTGAQSISRCPDGSDTNQNNVDFSLHPSTPGTPNACVADEPPSVTGTSPANGAVDVPVNSNIDINFSENVTVTADWFSIACAVSGAHTAIVSGGPQNFTLDPDADFAAGELCTVTVLAANVVDQDGTPDPMAADFVFSFTTAGPVCEQPFTPIYSIQGSGPAAAITGNVTTQGVVVGDFDGSISTGIQGFYLQDAAGDGDGATSDGIFVFTGDANLVTAGQVVRVTGFARERFNQTALNGSNSNSSPVTNIVDCGAGSVTAADVLMPFPSADYLERFEGMLVRFPQALVISEYFNYERFGELVLALPLDGESRAFTPTAIDEPGAPALARALANSLRRITLDDGLGSQNPDFLRHPNGDAYALDNPFRGGDTVQNTVGVLGFDFSLYRIQPTGPADYSVVNPRPAAPEPVGGRLQVAAMNTLNFFITLDYPSGDPLDNKCGPLQNFECRGADSDQPLEFTRQRDKLIAALAGLDADIIGLNELENTVGVNPIGDPINGIVAGLNAIPGADPYAYIDTGVIGTDAIRVGLIYRPSKVAPVGDFKVLTSAVDPRFIDTKSRPALAQTFVELATGERFTVVVNHLKSKGSDCLDVGDPDAGDGQGNCNLTRKAAAEALVDWLASDPTGSGDPDFLIMGDLNSYAQEDPIDAIKAGADDTAGTGDDYTNLIAHYQGTYAYSYVFDGQAGYLDHALANPSLNAQVTGAADWHINSDEPDLGDYDTSFKPPAQEAIYEPNAYRSSDHDPVVVGLNLIPQCGGRNATLYVDLNNRIVGGPLNGLTYHGVLIGTSESDVIVGTGGGDTLLAIGGDDVVCGRGGDDIIFGGEGLDRVDGGDGHDIVDGGLGADAVFGGADNDKITGGPGSDALDGGAGTDICNGGLGTDTATACETSILIP